ncbi:unnamed protein product [Tenebrio molitor]|nr:unnamed protein product [Tenebrio molitor]
MGYIPFFISSFILPRPTVLNLNCDSAFIVFWRPNMYFFLILSLTLTQNIY